MEGELGGYLHELTGRLRHLLGRELVAITLIGSAGAGSYEPGASDLDVAVVVTGPLDAGRARLVADRLSHRRLPCPARKLELVVYTRAALAHPAARIPFELNLNSGAGERDHVGLDPAAEASHWFLLDLAIARGRDRPLYGPALNALLGEIPRRLQLEAARRSLDWFADCEPDPGARVLAACRSWHYAAVGEWAAKRDSALWASARLTDPTPVDRALALRSGGSGPQPDEADVAVVLDRARAALDAAA